jgi:phosphomannomutase
MGLGGAVNFTASHNPAQYQGLKFSPSWGGPALPETTGRIEELCGIYLEAGLPGTGVSKGQIAEFDPVPAYAAKLSEMVDIGLISSSGLPLAFDALYGAGAGFLDVILEEAGCGAHLLHTENDPTFGGGPPEPSEERLKELALHVQKTGGLGISTDGDADRFGILGAGGEFYQPNTILALLADYVLGQRKMAGDLARSVATTHQLDTVAAAYGRRCHETPVGFKYIGEMIHRGELALGGEESAGMSIGGHIPEKDGILACLLVAEMVAAAGREMADLKSDLDTRFGLLHTERVNMAIDDEISARMASVLAAPPTEVGGYHAAELVTVDGTKWLFEDGSWTLLRLSGTEPVARLYVEAASKETFEGLKEAFGSWIMKGEG